MKEALICRPNSAKRLALTNVPCRELSNFLIYRNNPEILTEWARRQSPLCLTDLPREVTEIGTMLGAEKCEKKRKLYLDCTNGKNHCGVLIHNFDAQFWVHYFRCGIGLVSVSSFGQLASAEGSVRPSMTRTIADSYEYQWFTHDLAEKYFQKKKSRIKPASLGKYFVERINPSLVSPYKIYHEPRPGGEPYKFVKGNLAGLKEIMKQAFLVHEGIKLVTEPDQGYRVSTFLTVICGSLRRIPAIEHSEYFLHQVGTLAIKENTPYMALEERYGWRTQSSFVDRKDWYRLYLDFRNDLQTATPREKLTARFHLVKWLQRQGHEGELIIKTWKLSEGSG